MSCWSSGYPCPKKDTGHCRKLLVWEVLFVLELLIVKVFLLLALVLLNLPGFQHLLGVGVGLIPELLRQADALHLTVAISLIGLSVHLRSNVAKALLELLLKPGIAEAAAIHCTRVELRADRVLGLANHLIKVGVCLPALDDLIQLALCVLDRARAALSALHHGLNPLILVCVQVLKALAGVGVVRVIA